MTFTLSHSRNAQSDRLLGSTHVMSGMKYLELCSRPEITDVTFLQRQSLCLTEEYGQREQKPAILLRSINPFKPNSFLLLNYAFSNTAYWRRQVKWKLEVFLAAGLMQIELVQLFHFLYHFSSCHVLLLDVPFTVHAANPCYLRTVYSHPHFSRLHLTHSAFPLVLRKKWFFPLNELFFWEQSMLTLR
jgi:hypothetical protein